MPAKITMEVPVKMYVAPVGQLTRAGLEKSLESLWKFDKNLANH